MKPQNLLKFTGSIQLPLPLSFALACIVCSSPLGAQTIPVPNGDFSDPGNAGSRSGILGLFGTYDDEISDGPWSLEGDGVLGVIVSLAPPTSTISSGAGGNVTFSGLLSLGAGIDLARNSARTYQDDIGADLIGGSTYRLTAQVTTGSVLTLDLLSDAGFGIGLLANGDTVASTTSTANLINLVLLGGSTYQLTLDYTATALDAGQDLGIELYVGRPDQLLTTSLLGDTSFDNVTLAIIPEPSSALLAGATGALALLRRRR